MTEIDLAEIHEKMCSALAEQGARIDDIFYCPHEEGACDCRKPRPGLVRRANEKWDIDLSRSLLIGDSERDAELAQQREIKLCVGVHLRDAAQAQDRGARILHPW